MDGPLVNSMSTARSLPSMDVEQQDSGISADEIALYDRQIRLWGVQAQEKIRSAKVLLVNVKGTGTEIAKNLILNGIQSLTISDVGLVQESDLGAQYFLRPEDVGQFRAVAASARLQELNPRVSVIVDTTDVTQKGPDYFSAFDMIIASDMPFFMLSLVNAGTRVAGRPFYATGIHGFYGFVFADLIEHEYIIEREQSNRATAVGDESTTRKVVDVNAKKENGKNIELVTKKEKYTPLMLANSSPLPAEYLRNRRRMRGVSPLLPAMRALWDFERNTGRFPSHSREDLVGFTTLVNEKLKELQLPPDLLKADFLRNFLQGVGAEIVPTAAFVGGRLAEDVINVLGKREQPIQNMLLFDGEGFQAPIYALHPIFEAALPTSNGSSGTPHLPQSDLPGSGTSAVPTSNDFNGHPHHPQPDFPDGSTGVNASTTTTTDTAPTNGTAQTSGTLPTSNGFSEPAPREDGEHHERTDGHIQTSVGPVADINSAPAPTNANPES
ncbi:ThiF-like protein 2 [Elsinoe fawcettii]|nr:ThiF-like protein 2 [Elsinoe fawcettii]